MTWNWSLSCNLSMVPNRSLERSIFKIIWILSMVSQYMHCSTKKITSILCVYYLPCDKLPRLYDERSDCLTLCAVRKPPGNWKYEATRWRLNQPHPPRRRECFYLCRFAAYPVKAPAGLQRACVVLRISVASYIWYSVANKFFCALRKKDRAVLIRS